MTVVRETKKFIDEFDRNLTITAGTPKGYWNIKDTSSSGTPTYVSTSTADGGLYTITLDNTDEAQVVTLYQTDKLFYDLAKLQHVWWLVKVADIDAQTVLVAGVGSAQADDEDTMATNAWFKIEGATSTSALVVETDDGARDLDDKSTGKTLSTTLKKLHLDFTYGINDVRFFIDGDRVAQHVQFDMSLLTAGLNVQPFLQLSKAGGTGTPSVGIAQYGIVYTYEYGA